MGLIIFSEGYRVYFTYLRQPEIKMELLDSSNMREKIGFVEVAI